MPGGGGVLHVQFVNLFFREIAEVQGFCFDVERRPADDDVLVGEHDAVMAVTTSSTRFLIACPASTLAYTAKNSPHAFK